MSSGIIKDRLIQETSEKRKNYFIKSQQKLDRCYYRSLMEKLDTSSIYRDLRFQNSKSEIWPMMTWMIRVSFLTTLVICKDYFKSHHWWKQIPKIHILYVKLLHLYALAFCNQVHPNLHRLWSEELCSQQQSIKLLKLVTY